MPDAGTITGFHAHIYFDEASEDDARIVREAIDEQFDTKLGRWHHKPVGPHPIWMYQVAFKPEDLRRPHPLAHPQSARPDDLHPPRNRRLRRRPHRPRDVDGRDSGAEYRRTA